MNIEVKKIKAFKRYRFNESIRAQVLQQYNYTEKIMIYFISVCIVSARQRGLANCLHQATHHCFASNQYLNYFLGTFSSGYLIFQSFHGMQDPIYASLHEKMNYIQFLIPTHGEKQPGALGYGRKMDTEVTMSYSCLCNLSPIGAAIILVLTSIPELSKVGIGFPGVPVGAFKSIMSPLMAEQYIRKLPVIKVIKGQRKIISPEMTIQSFFNWFYWAENFGAFIAELITATGSLVVRAFHVTYAALRNLWKLEKQTLHACRVFVFFPLFWMCFNQEVTNLNS
ncbi:hypothetical protein I4U23_004645 [Adineta vaga]|nr:hypothetical protein I4U23_004645 [Adineta vaga]